MPPKGKETDRKLTTLLRDWPSGVVYTRRRLAELGITRQNASRYVSSKWIQRIGTEAYARSGDNIDWRGGMYALQSQLGLTVHPGAMTSLALLGFAHYLPQGDHSPVKLLSDRPGEQLPKWFRDYPWKGSVSHHCFNLFARTPGNSFRSLDCGTFLIHISGAERAMLEQMHMVRTNADVDLAVELMSGLPALRPSVCQAHLEACRSIKAKRLFLWAATEAGHRWLDRVDESEIELGSGKRQLYKGGRLDPTYKITVPRNKDIPRV